MLQDGSLADHPHPQGVSNPVFPPGNKRPAWGVSASVDELKYAEIHLCWVSVGFKGGLEGVTPLPHVGVMTQYRGWIGNG
jgi:hypothetical protein